MSSKKIYVYENWSGELPFKLGTLFSDLVHGEEIYSFEYDRDWLKANINNYTLDTELEFYNGRQYSQSKNLFGIFSDSAPDRWGEMLMKRRESILARKEDRKPRKLTKLDFLLGVDDTTRMGALRFKLDENGPFVSNNKGNQVPLWVSIRDLEEAARGFELDSDESNDNWLRQLIEPGSSLGGARPKATVQNTDGSLWIAKFPSKHDECDIALWEKVANDLAKKCGLNVPNSLLQKFSQYGHTFLVKRFDRNNDYRIHFTSALTLLNKNDGASGSDGSSYLNIFDFIKSNGSNPKADTLELWKRIVFSMAISNTDDHLRNHGFILNKNGWSLSPLFDINPVPFGEHLTLNVIEGRSDFDIDTLIHLGEMLDINTSILNLELNRILTVVNSNWQPFALKYGASRNDIEKMKPSFRFAEEHHTITEH